MAQMAGQMAAMYKRWTTIDAGRRWLVEVEWVGVQVSSIQAAGSRLGKQQDREG